MASSETDSRLNSVPIPAQEKIVKNSSWRKHSKLSTQCKSLIEHLTSPNQNPPATPTSTTPPPSQSAAQSDGDKSSPSALPGVLLDLSFSDSKLILSPLITAASSGDTYDCLPAFLLNFHQFSVKI